MTFKAFEKDGQSFSVGDLTFENNVDRLAIYGSVNIEKDRAGLKKAIELQHILNDLVATLNAETDLPEAIEKLAVKQVKNPFL